MEKRAASNRILMGLIVNPIAGMGGKVALKGTDGTGILREARLRGAVPEASDKAERALKMLCPYRESITLLTVSGEMGEELCKKLSIPYRLVYRCGAETSAQDTMEAARAMEEYDMKLLLFAGGDGTARDICQAVGQSFPVLGIPAGVKIQSAVFGLTPEASGSVASLIARGIPISSSGREVADLNEEEYRSGHVSAKLYGLMQVPCEPAFVQNMKQSGFSSEYDQLGGIASYLEEKMEPDVYYAIGSGSTAKCISRRLGIEQELLGVDVICNKKLIARDVSEATLWEFAKEGNLKIIVSPIGGQGFLFGRGNHQFSPRVLSAVGKNGIQVIAPESKLLSIPHHTLHVDCADPDVSETLRGYYNILCGYGMFHSFRCQ